MIGKVTKFDVEENSGYILGIDKKIYKFDGEEFKEHYVIYKDLHVNFEVNKDLEAVCIYENKEYKDNTNIVLGIISIFFTLLLSFIGTLFSRLFYHKFKIDQVIIPTIIHITLNTLIFLPYVGWIVFIASNLYFSYLNYTLITTKKDVGIYLKYLK